MNRHTFVRRRRLRSSALLSVTALATSSLMLSASPVGAALSQGEKDAATGAPTYFVDQEGLALQLCTAPEPNCEPSDEATFVGTYFAAEAQAGPVHAIYGIEAAFGEDDAGNPTDEVLVSNSALFRAENLTPGAKYTIKDPWGTKTCTADNRGELDNKNCLFETGGEAGGSASAGHVRTFLRSADADAGFIGSHELNGPVTGSPTGFNRVTVTGPGVNETTNSFSLMGQMLDDTPMSTLNVRALKLGKRTQATPSTATVRLSSFGTADVTASVTKSGANPGAFAVTNNCTDVAPGSTCDIAVTYTPRANHNASAVLTVDDGGLAAPRTVTLTGVAHDTLAPKLASRTPAKGADNVRTGKNVKVSFTEAVRGVKGSLTLVATGTGKQVRATVSKARQGYVLNPRRALRHDTSYTVKLNGGQSNIRDLAGNAARDVQWKFRTR